MTSRLDAALAVLRAGGRKALVTYLCVGDPSIDESVELAVACAQAGADVLELGVPFSDPTADGPAIARASQRAIAGGATLGRVLDAAARIRARSPAPMVLFGYYNPILVAGEARVAQWAAEAGVDALLVVDLPPEEARPLRALASARGLAVVTLVAPTTARERAVEITRPLREGSGARGFVYYVSMTGVTGASPPDLGRASSEAAALRDAVALPVVVGFGIDGPDAARAAAGPTGAGADGVVVGSALVRRIESAVTPSERMTSVTTFVRSLRAALDAKV